MVAEAKWVLVFKVLCLASCVFCEDTPETRVQGEAQSRQRRQTACHPVEFAQREKNGFQLNFQYCKSSILANIFDVIKVNDRFSEIALKNKDDEFHNYQVKDVTTKLSYFFSKIIFVDANSALFRADYGVLDNTVPRILLVNERTSSFKRYLIVGIKLEASAKVSNAVSQNFEALLEAIQNGLNLEFRLNSLFPDNQEMDRYDAFESANCQNVNPFTFIDFTHPLQITQSQLDDWTAIPKVAWVAGKIDPSHSALVPRKDETAKTVRFDCQMTMDPTKSGGNDVKATLGFGTLLGITLIHFFI